MIGSGPIRLAEGVIDFEPIMRALADAGFEGRLVVEAERTRPRR
jgi:sugar phosphate isomerase/epimerase